MKRIVIEIDDELHKSVKMRAVSQEWSIKNYVKQLIMHDLAKEKEQTQ